MSTQNREQVIKKYVGDMHGVVKHVLEAIERQVEDEDVHAQPDVHKLLVRVTTTLKSHHEKVHKLADEVGAQATPVKAAVTAVAGVAAGLYDKIRSHAVSKMLRDDYTALTMTAMAYEMLHTKGLTLKEPKVAELALSLLNDIPPYIMEIGRLVPKVIAAEFQADGIPADASVAATAVQNIEAAWKSAPKTASLAA